MPPAASDGADSTTSTEIPRAVLVWPSGAVGLEPDVCAGPGSAKPADVATDDGVRTSLGLAEHSEASNHGRSHSHHEKVAHWRCLLNWPGPCVMRRRQSPSAVGLARNPPYQASYGTQLRPDARSRTAQRMARKGPSRPRFVLLDDHPLDEAKSCEPRITWPIAGLRGRRNAAPAGLSHRFESEALSVSVEL